MSVFIEYFSYNQKRADALWENFPDDLARARAGERFEMSMDPLGCLVNQGDLKNEGFVLLNLKLLDLNYGSVHCEPIESAKEEWPILEALAKASGIHLSSENFSKEDWLQIYSMIDKDFINKVIEDLVAELDWTYEEGYGATMEFLSNVKPLIKDLKENNDSIFVVYADSSNEVSPKSAENILMQRAKEHWEKYQKIIMLNAK